MLEPGAEVRALNTTRVMSFPKDMREVCGKKELAWADKPSTMILYTVAMMFASKVKCYAFELDEEKITSAKAAAASDGGVTFISTNDILTSGFFNVTKARIGMMGHDCRDRPNLMPGYDKDLAGNYVTALVLGPEVFATPASLRNMYSVIPYKTTQRRLPSIFGGCCGSNARFAMTTNWSTFAGNMISLDGCELQLTYHCRIRLLRVRFDDTISCRPGKRAVLI